MAAHPIKARHIIEVVAFAILLIIIIALSGCSNDDPESAEARTERLLQSSWRLDRLVVDGTDQTSLFSNLLITVTAGSYTAQNGEPIWPASGTWTLIDANTIDRDNGFVVKIKSITETTLSLSLQWEDTTFEPGRASSVAGEHVFEFVKD